MKISYPTTSLRWLHVTSQSSPARKASVPASMSTRLEKETALAADAVNPIRKSASRSTTTARLKVSTRPWSGILALSAAGLLTAASCCWINFSANLYGQTLRVEVVDWLRDQRKFSGIDSLKQQLNKDIESTVELTHA